MDVEQREHVVSGFAFYSEKDARLAEQERQKIAYLAKEVERWKEIAKSHDEIIDLWLRSADRKL